jgi:transposase-like protein
LLREVHAIGYLATGRRYGVTDNAIRKWIRQYGKERAARSDPAGPLTDLTDGYAAA